MTLFRVVCVCGCGCVQSSQQIKMHICMKIVSVRNSIRVLNVPNNLSVDSAGHAVLELQVHLGNGVVAEDGSIGDITCK